MNQSTQQDTLTRLLDNIPSRIIAHFSTNTEFRLDQGLDQIQIDTNYNEQALNHLLKQMFKMELQSPKFEFDFLINGKLLLGTIKSHILRYEISCEEIIEIQYIAAYTELVELTQQPVQDWISCICQVMGQDSNIGVLSGSFDGSIVFHEKITEKKSKIMSKIHDAPIKSIKSLPSEKQNIYYIVSGGLDQELKISKFGVESVPEIISANEHEGSVLAVDFNPDLNGHICTGGASGKLNIWKIPQNFLQQQTTEIKTQKRKKRKTNKKNLPFLAYNQSHKDSINSICWLTSSIIATGSSDHSIKLTDVQKMREQRIFLTKDSITTSIDFSADIIYSSHEDGYLRTWDIRSPTTNPTETFKSHRRYASCVKKQEHWTTFASGSYDETIKIWDTRSVFPVQTIMTNQSKIFSVAWMLPGHLVSGGSSPFLSLHRGPGY